MLAAMFCKKIVNEVKSPCIDVCNIDESEDRCANCGRPLEKIMTWADMTPSEREEIMRQLTEMGYPNPDA